MKKRIKMAVVGLRFGEYVVECQILGQPGMDAIELVGVFDLDASKSSKIAQKHAVRQYASLDKFWGIRRSRPSAFSRRQTGARN